MEENIWNILNDIRSRTESTEGHLRNVPRVYTMQQQICLSALRQNISRKCRTVPSVQQKVAVPRTTHLLKSDCQMICSSSQLPVMGNQSSFRYLFCIRPYRNNQHYRRRAKVSVWRWLELFMERGGKDVASQGVTRCHRVSWIGTGVQESDYRGQWSFSRGLVFQKSKNSIWKAGEIANRAKSNSTGASYLPRSRQ